MTFKKGDYVQMKNSKAKRHGFIYVIAALLLVMTFVIISSDQVFAGGKNFYTATQFKLNKNKVGTTPYESCYYGGADYYKFKTSPVRASYKFILHDVGGEEDPYVGLYDSDYDYIDCIWTDNAATKVFNGLKKNATYYLAIRNDHVYDNCSDCDYVFQIKETITPPAKVVISKVKSGKKKLSVTWKLAARAKKYQISIRKGKGKWKTYTTTARKKTFTKLASKKKYSVRVRGFFKYKGKNRFGKWSKVKTVKVK